MNRETNEEATLEDFVLVLTEGTARLMHDKKRAYEIIAFILSDFLHNSEKPPKIWH